MIGCRRRRDGRGNISRRCWKVEHGLRNTWGSSTTTAEPRAVVREGLWEKFESMFRNFGWRGHCNMDA